MTKFIQTNLPKRRFLSAMICGAVVVALPAVSARAQDFPSRPITLVSPYQAGGAADGIGRALAAAASKHLGQPVVLESKPGAEGMIGAADVMNADADGYRLLWGGAGSMMLVTALRKNPPFDPVENFTPIAGSVDFSFFLYVHPDVGANTVEEFIEIARANPGQFNYGTGNNQGLLSFAYFNKEYGLDLQHIAYQGEVAAISDLVPGRIQALFATTSALPYVKDGSLKALVTTLPERSPLLPDVPTMEESGLEGVPFSPGGGWLGIYGPAGVDPSVVETLNEAFTKAYNDPAVQQQIQSVGLAYTEMDASQFAEFSLNQRDQYLNMIRDLGIPQVE